MNWWDWVDDFRRRAAEAKDGDRLRLAFLHQQAYGYRERDPARYLALCEEGRRLARGLGEDWWVLFYVGEVVQQFVHHNRDFRRALDLAVAAVLEARKPVYDQCPIRMQIHLDLLCVHFGTDPEGHAEAIEAGFREIERETPPDLSSRLRLLNLRRWCAEQGRRVEDHRAAARTVLAAIAEESDHPASMHYSTFVYNGLCRVHFATREWQELGETAVLAEEASLKVGHQVELAESYLWQALHAFHDGDLLRGRRLQRRGVGVMDKLGVPPPDGYFEALSACHEHAGQTNDALAVRNRELELLRKQGRTFSEVFCHKERCRLLAAEGRLTAADLEAAREAARRLRFPGRHLAELDRLFVPGL